MKVGSLFSGGGLGDFGFVMAGMEIAWQVEIDEYCQKILELRYPESKKYRNIMELNAKKLETVDIITGGFPCQPFSVAGKQKGKDDNRYLWPEMLRIIKECRPSWVIGENVPGIINMALETVCADLEAQGYEVWPIVFPSHALGAWHKRDRIWIICHSKHDGQFTTKDTGSIETRSGSGQTEQEQASESKRSSEQYAPMANAGCESTGNKKERFSIESEYSGTPWFWTEKGNRSPDGGWWSTEPLMGRVANGIADRVHRLRMLGNGQTPCSTYVIAKFIQLLTE